MAVQGPLTAWPSPLHPISKATAALLLGVSKDTLERAVRATLTGAAPNTQVGTVAALFARAGKGSKILAQLIYDALGLDWQKLKGPFFIPLAPAKPNTNRRKRSVVPSAESLTNLGADELREELAKAIQQVRANSGGKVPWRRLKAVADTLRDRGLPPQGMIHGQAIARIDLSKCETWGFVGVFLAQAEPADLWPFVLPARSRRPVDLFSASSDDIKYGQLIGLTVEEWLELMAAALADERRQERSESEAEFLKAAVQPVAGNASNSNEAS